MSILRLGAMALLAAVVAGCQIGDPHDRWQSSLQAYTAARGGNLNALAELNRDRSHRTLRPARIEFRTRHRPVPLAAEVESVGVLIGAVERPGAKWYVFLVGAQVVNDKDPAEVRLIAARPGPGDWTFVTGEQQHPATPATSGSAGFPPDDAYYEMKTTGDSVVVREVNGPGEWTLSLAAAPS